MQPAPDLPSIAAACWQVTIRDWTHPVRVPFCGQAVLGNFPRNGFMAFGTPPQSLGPYCPLAGHIQNTPMLQPLQLAMSRIFPWNPRTKPSSQKVLHAITDNHFEQPPHSRNVYFIY